MGSTKTPVLEQTGYLALDKIPPVYHNKRIYNEQYSLHHTNGETMVQSIGIHNWGIKLQKPCMVLENSAIISRNLYCQPTGIIEVRNTHLPHHPKIGTRDGHPVLYGNIKCPGVDVQGLILPSQGRTPQHS